MNRDEDRILHGLFHDREMVGETMIMTGSEVLWLTKHSFAEGAKWRKDGKLQSLDLSQQSTETIFRLITAEQSRPIRYLAERGFIISERTKVTDAMLRIAVTGQGADRARRLHTWLGRRGVWYSDHKDGVAGLLVAALVAILVSLITNWLIHRRPERPESTPPHARGLEWVIERRGRLRTGAASTRH